MIIIGQRIITILLLLVKRSLQDYFWLQDYYFVKIKLLLIQQQFEINYF